MNKELQEKIVKNYFNLNKSYANLTKKTSLFSFWLSVFSNSLKNNIFLEDKTTSIIIALEKEEGIKQAKQIENEVSFIQYCKQFILSLLRFIPLKKGYLIIHLPDFSKRLVRIIMEQKVLNLVAEIDLEKKERFFSKLQSLCSESEFHALRGAIPDIFFAKSIQKFGFPSVIEGIPLSFLDPNFMKVLFLSQEITFIGKQHGGGFGELRGFKIEEFEKSFSDEYFFWGLGANNCLQNRFEVLASSERKLEGVCFLGTTKLSSTFSYLINFDKNEYEEVLKRRENLTRDLHVPLLFMASHKNKEIEHGVPTIFNERDIFLQSEVSKDNLFNKLFILDWVGHTFFYQAIYNSIPFILYFKREWTDSFTDEYKSLLDIIEKHNLIFFEDQEEAFFKRIYDLYNKKIYNPDVFIDSRKFLSRHQ